MKIDENLINHNLSQIVKELVSDIYNFSDCPEAALVNLAMLAGASDMAERMKEVLKE